MKKNKSIVILTLMLALLFILSGCKPQNLRLVKEVEFVLGTLGQIHVYSESEKQGTQAIKNAYTRIRNIENMMSTSIEGSDIFLLNEYAGDQQVNVDQETLYVINRGLLYYDLTEGDFNIALGSLINLWSIGKDTARVPSHEEITEAMKHTNISDISIDNQTVIIKDANMRIDLGGVAKGYAVDEAIKVLRSEGITSGLVNLGGDVYALGNKSDGTPWNVGIQDPELGSGVIGSVPLVDKSIVTSGDYERYFMEGDVRYHHIIDPKTGYPVQNNLRSVTIISDLSIDGDVLSTAIFIMGVDKGMALIESLDNIEGIIITSEKEIYASSGIKESIKISDNRYKLREF